MVRAYDRTLPLRLCIYEHSGKLPYNEYEVSHIIIQHTVIHPDFPCPSSSHLLCVCLGCTYSRKLYWRRIYTSEHVPYVRQAGMWLG